MDQQQWAARLDEFMADRLAAEKDGCHDIGHVRRVWKNCVDIAADEPEATDMLVLLAAAYLHDLVNPPKNSPDRQLASTHSAEAACGLLREWDFPAEKLASVEHAIRAHSFSAQIRPETQEARILQDADRLDALGAIGIARTFYTAGTMQSSMFDADDPFGHGRPLNDKNFAVDHFNIKLLRLAGSMTTATGKRLAEQRTTTMHRFLHTLSEELS